VSQPQFIAGLDLGQSADPSAFAVAEQSRDGGGKAHYSFRQLHRWPLQTPYPEIVQAVLGYLAGQVPGCTLVIDGTGVGRAVVDLFRATGAPVVPVLITAGQAVSKDQHGYRHVAKVQLVGTMKALSGHRRLRFAPALPLRKVVEKELETFKARVTPAGSEQFLADWRKGQHDDLVLAVALACWVGENCWCGPWQVTRVARNASLVGRGPPGVFIDHDGGGGDDDLPPRAW
jgi:hypothetical protein